MDLFSIGSAAGAAIFVAAAGGADRMIWKSIKPAARTASTMVIPIIFRPVRRVIDWSGAISDSSLIPSGVISKGHETTSAMGKPRRMTRIKIFITRGGARKGDKKLEAA